MPKTPHFTVACHDSFILTKLNSCKINPININASSAPELSRLYVLNEVQINKLLEYLVVYGPAFSIFELKTIDGFTPDLLKKIEPFIWFGPREEAKKMGDAFKYGQNQLLLRTLGTVQKASGYQPREDGSTPYEGNQYRYYTRYRYEASDQFSAGLLQKKIPVNRFLAVQINRDSTFILRMFH